MRRTLILLASLGIIFLGLWGSAAIFLDEERLKSALIHHVSEQTGRKLEIRGALQVDFFPRLRLRAREVVLSGPRGYDGPQLLEAESLSMSMRVLPLVRGNLSAGELALSGATINMHTDADGRSTLDGLMGAIRRQRDQGEEGVLASRQMRLEDVRLVISDVSTHRQDTVVIDQVELDRFSFDEPLQFRFVGNVGDPSLFEEMTVEGQLHVPSGRSKPLRLMNMRLSGDLSSTRDSLSLLGHLSFSGSPPLELELVDGRLVVGDQSMALEGIYRGQERGHLKIAAQAEKFRWPVTSGGSSLAYQRWLPLLRGMDVDLTARFDQARFGTVDIEALQGRVSVVEGTVTMERLEGFLYGTSMRGTGFLDIRYEEPRGELNIELEIGEMADFLVKLGLPPVLAGAGSGKMDVAYRREDNLWVSTAASGQVELWDGHWLAGSDDDGEVSVIEFNRLKGDFRILEDFVDLTRLALHDDDMEVLGWAAVDINDHSVGGRLNVTESGREIEVSGTLDEFRLSRPLTVDPSAIDSDLVETADHRSRD